MNVKIIAFVFSIQKRKQSRTDIAIYNCNDQTLCIYNTNISIIYAIIRMRNRWYFLLTAIFVFMRSTTLSDNSPCIYSGNVFNFLCGFPISFFYG
jgi:hypothetical protein